MNFFVTVLLQYTSLEDELAKLKPEEQYWSSRHAFLASKGFELRPRLRPGWKVPSALPVGKNGRGVDIETMECLYWAAMDLKDTIDVRDREGNLFYVRRMHRDSEELLMLEEFSTLSEQADLYNHILPIKDKFDDPDDPEIVFIVTDLLHYAHMPSFKYVEDAMDFFEQLFEALVFFHSRGVSNVFHGATLRMQTNMFPEGFHPVVQDRLPNCSSLAPFHERYKSSVQYVFTDLRYAMRNKSAEDPLGPSIDLKILSIKILGFLQECHKKKINLPTIDVFNSALMLTQPDTQAALERWRKLRRSLGYFQRWSRLYSTGPFSLFAIAGQNKC